MASKIAIAAGLLMLYGIIVLILLRVMPGPHKSVDYMVIGTLATLICIVAVFFLNLAIPGGPTDPFFKRRKND